LIGGRAKREGSRSGGQLLIFVSSYAKEAAGLAKIRGGESFLDSVPFEAI
jgi:hypothetical protein